MSAQSILICVMLAILLGVVVGYVFGRNNGKNEGWLDHYFATVEKDRARREKNGQFKAREAAR